MFISQFKIFMFNHKIIKAVEIMQHTVNFKHLLKDAVFDNMRSNEGLPVNLEITRIRWEMKYFHLPQSFLLTEMNPTRIPERPFLLIPLFKILDSEGEEVNYRYFEADEYNQIQVLPIDGVHRFFDPGDKTADYSKGEAVNYRNIESDEYNQIQVLSNDGPRYLGAERWPPVEDHKLTLIIKGSASNLSQSLFVNHNGYLIFKDHHSECAMVYVGIFIDEGPHLMFLNTQLGKIYKQYIQKNSQKENEIKESDITFELEFNIAKLQGRKLLDVFIQKKYIPEYEKRMGLHLNIPEMENDLRNLKVRMKGVSLNGELAFEITKYLNSEIFDHKFLSLYFPDRRDERDYKKFVNRLKRPKRSQRILHALGACVLARG